ncbi:hypothetical protein M2432_005571 [Mycobacterium sp. OTB74]|nr:hypothetical protein [Mycobacterium sp. OTB74]
MNTVPTQVEQQPSPHRIGPLGGVIHMQAELQERHLGFAVIQADKPGEDRLCGGNAMSRKTGQVGGDRHEV